LNRGAEITPLEMTMLTEAQRIANTREHLSWAYRVAIFWAVFATTLGTIIVTSAVWQQSDSRLPGSKTSVLPSLRD
jgi:type IV secretory pathway component VirB8